MKAISFKFGSEGLDFENFTFPRINGAFKGESFRFPIKFILSEYSIMNNNIKWNDPVIEVHIIQTKHEMW